MEIQMNQELAEKLRENLSMSPQEAVAFLQQLGPTAATDLLLGTSFEEQQILFRHLPFELAAALVPRFPYYHSYVLLHSRPVAELRAIIDKITPADRIRFLDELPEEAWKQLMDELSGKAPVVQEIPAAPPVAETAVPVLPSSLPAEPAPATDRSSSPPRRPTPALLRPRLCRLLLR
jgi:Mg/Co/Ni transporter MgtE